jgi:type III restriction enzyme
VREYEIEASEADIERQFAEAGQRLTNGLHKTYWDAHAERDGLEVQVEVIALARSHEVMVRLEAKAEGAFDALYDRHKHATAKLKEKDRVRYERLRLATAKPVELPWRLPERIEFRRTEDAPSCSPRNWTTRMWSAGCATWTASPGLWRSPTRAAVRSGPCSRT